MNFCFLSYVYSSIATHHFFHPFQVYKQWDTSTQLYPFPVWDCQHWISINQVKSATSCALRIKVTLLQNLNICNNLVCPLENDYNKIHIYLKEVTIFLGCFSRQNNDMFCFNNLWYKFSIFLFIVLSSCQAKNFWYLQKFFRMECKNWNGSSFWMKIAHHMVYTQKIIHNILLKLILYVLQNVVFRKSDVNNIN